MAIHFYSKTQEYYWLSNFSKHGFSLNGQYWPTVEHYFQAQKFPNHPLQEEIRLAEKPSKAKKLGRTRSVSIREDWEDIKEQVMKEALLAKFNTHEELRQQLLETGDEELIEAAPADYYWGCGKTGTGKNRLGVLLMEVRRQLRSEETV